MIILVKKGQKTSITLKQYYSSSLRFLLFQQSKKNTLNQDYNFPE